VPKQKQVAARRALARKRQATAQAYKRLRVAEVAEAEEEAAQRAQPMVRNSEIRAKIAPRPDTQKPICLRAREVRYASEFTFFAVSR
jgi:hypothetical protein